MFCEFHCHAGVCRSLQRQLDSYLQHVMAEKRHPCSAVGLLQKSSGGKRGAAVENTDVVQSKETAFKRVFTCSVLAVHPPDEVHQQLLEDAFEPFNVTAPAAALLQPISEDRGPRVHGRVNVAKIPFVSR